MENQVVKSTGKEVGAPMKYDWGTNESSSSDIVIPKIQLMQGMSQKVIAGEARLGDYVDSVSGEVLGSVEKPLEVIPFHMEKFFVVQKLEKVKGKEKYVYDHIEKITPANENAPWDYEHEGAKFKRVYTRNFYVLVPGQVLPYVVGFSSTSAKAGKELATEMFVKNVMQGKAPCASKILLGGKIESNDSGTYAVKGIKVSGPTTQEEIALAFQWFQTVSKQETKVDAGEDF